VSSFLNDANYIHRIIYIGYYSRNSFDTERLFEYRSRVSTLHSDENFANSVNAEQSIWGRLPLLQLDICPELSNSISSVPITAPENGADKAASLRRDIGNAMRTIARTWYILIRTYIPTPCTDIEIVKIFVITVKKVLVNNFRTILWLKSY